MSVVLLSPIVYGGQSRAVGYVITDTLAYEAGLVNSGVAKWQSQNLQSALSVRAPLWIECLSGFGRAGSGTPGGLTNYPDGTVEAGYAVNTARVTGGKGETSLTLNTGTVADLSGQWAAVIGHDDGVYRTYTVRNASGAALSVYPPLRANATRAVITNLHNAAEGQHLSQIGYYALADYVYRYSPMRAERTTYLSQWAETAASGWTLVGGQSSGRIGYNSASNIINSGAILSAEILMRNTRGFFVDPAANGQGASYTFALGGASGYIDSYVGSQSATLPVIAQVVVDGNLVYNQLIYGLERIVVPFEAATSATITYTMSALDVSGFYVGTTTAWKRPAIGYASQMFPSGSRVVMLGDSWSTKYNAAFIERMNYWLEPNGGSAVTVGLAGQTSVWALANFASLVTPKSPTHVILEFFVNDQVSGLTSTQLQANLLTLASMCYAIGAQPIIIMPTATASQSQTQLLAIIGAQIAEGVQG